MSAPRGRLHLPFFVFVFLSLAKQLWVVSHWVDSLQDGIARLILCTLGFLLILGAFACLRPGRRQLAWMLAWSAGITVLSLSDLLHHRAFSDLSSAASLRYAHQLPGVFSSLPVLLRWSDLWLLADLPALLLLWRLPAGRWYAFGLRSAGACVALGALLISAVFLTTPRLGSPRQPGNAFVAGELGVLGYHLWDGASTLTSGFGGLRITQEDLEELAQRFHREPAPLPDLHGVAAGKNLIVIQVESLQGFLGGLHVAGGPVTPYLDALAEESVLRGALFHQTAVGRTSDAHFAFNCSLYPSVRGAASFRYARNSLSCLPEILGENGYRSYAFQSLAPDYWNAAAIESAMGFSRSFSGDDLEIDEIIGIGLSDASFLRQVEERLMKSDEPFYAFLQTLTSHTPFRFPGLPTFDTGEAQGSFFGSYLTAVHYADRQVGLFVRRLRDSGLLDRSVLVIYGDHDGINRNQAQLDRHLSIDPDDEWSLVVAERRVSMVVRLPGGAHAGAKEVFAGQIDLAPTLLGLLGISRDGSFFLGRDLLAESRGEETVVFPDGTVLTRDRVLQLQGGARCFRAGGKRLDACPDLERRAGQELLVSQQLLDGDLLPRLIRDLPNPKAP